MCYAHRAIESAASELRAIRRCAVRRAVRVCSSCPEVPCRSRLRHRGRRQPDGAWATHGSTRVRSSSPIRLAFRSNSMPGSLDPTTRRSSGMIPRSKPPRDRAGVMEPAAHKRTVRRPVSQPVPRPRNRLVPRPPHRPSPSHETTRPRSPALRLRELRSATARNSKGQQPLKANVPTPRQTATAVYLKVNGREPAGLPRLRVGADLRRRPTSRNLGQGGCRGSVCCTEHCWWWCLF